MAVNLAPGLFGVGGQFFSGNIPLNGGLIYTYAAGTTTPQPTFTTSTGNIANSNPILLNANGILPQEVWLTAGIAYKFVVTDAVGNVIFPYTMDNLKGINDFSSIPTGTEWTDTGLTTTFVSTTSFSLPGDQTASGTGTMVADRRVKIIETAGTVYGFITSSSVTASITTVNVLLDSGAVIDNGISDVQYGILSPTHISIPKFIQPGTNITVTYDTQGRPIVSNTLVVTVLQNLLAGYTLSTAGSSATMAIGAGQATDSTNAAYITLATAFTKTTAAWAVGTGLGGLDTGTIATTATWYHFYAIDTAAGGAPDITFSLNAATPALSGSYVGGKYRYIGSGLINTSSQWVAFIQYPNGEFRWVNPPLDQTGIAFGAYAARTISTPLGVSVLAFGSLHLNSGDIINIRPTGTSDPVPSFSTGTFGYGLSSNIAAMDWQCQADTLSQVSVGGNTTSISTQIFTKGYFNARGQ
jgi:hypothetical protein